jgi:mannose-6-phosphate isomerase
LRFEPLLKVRVWGGDALPQRIGQTSEEPIGESWELCDHDEDMSTIANGPARGRKLRDLMAEDRDGLCGSAYDPNRPDRFPLMLKLLDAQQDLSVQVHPNDRYAHAQKPGELGKTEAWYILNRSEGACIYRGLKAGTGADELRGAMEAGTVDQVLKKVPVEPGEVYHLPSGTVHALGAGVQIAEIQQNSDTTYRLFDWNRVGLDGAPRPLHLEDGLAVSCFEPDAQDQQVAETVACETAQRERFIRCEKFTLERFSKLTGPVHLTTGGTSFHLITVIDGSVTVNAEEGSETLDAWQSCLLPAACYDYSLEGTDNASLLLYYIEK